MAYHARGVQLSEKIEETGIVLVVLLEELTAVCLDLGDFNQGASATNAMESIFDFVKEIFSTKRIPAEHIKLYEIDSAGRVDCFGVGGWRNIALGNLKDIPAGDAKVLEVVLGDEYYPFKTRIRQTLAHLKINLLVESYAPVPREKGLAPTRSKFVLKSTVWFLEIIGS